MKLLIILLCCGIAMSQERKEKAFSLFSVVQFPNIACASSSTDFPMGTCYAATECTEKGGAASGNCAAGFGVCCVFKSSTCGETISNNMTYISNPNYPVAYAVTAANTCAWTVKKMNSDICQLRIDFETMVTSVSTSAPGCCGSSCIINSDSFTAVGENALLKSTPTLCGTNTGYHMYVELGTDEADTATLTFYSDTATAISNRLWNAKVSQIECMSDWRAPPGCTQYFMGLRNTVYSYNHAGKIMLDAQEYTNCVRREVGYCGLRWRDTGSSSPDSFAVAVADDAIADSAEHLACADGWVSIPGGVKFAGNFRDDTIKDATYPRSCGTIFGEQGTKTSSETDTTKSFLLGVYTKVGQVLAADIGFALRYEQQACD